MLIILMELTNLLQGVCLNAELLGKLQISYLSKKKGCPRLLKTELSWSAPNETLFVVNETLK